MKRILLLCVFAVSLPVFSQTAVLPVYYCTEGGTQALVSGMSSTNYLQGIIPSCLVTVYLTGTQTVATTTPQSPFTANTDGSIQPIYAATGIGYDVVLSGGFCPDCYLTPVTLTDVIVGGGGGGGGITQLTGAVTAGPGTGSVASTIEPVNFAPGSCGDATNVCQITTNAAGQTTVQTPVPIVIGNVNTTTQSGSATYYPVFVPANSTANQVVGVGPMSYNPGTNTFTVGGMVIGNDIAGVLSLLRVGTSVNGQTGLNFKNGSAGNSAVSSACFSNDLYSYATGLGTICVNINSSAFTNPNSYHNVLGGAGEGSVAIYGSHLNLGTTGAFHTKLWANAQLVMDLSGPALIKFPGLAATSGNHYGLQIDETGLITNTGAAPATISPPNAGQPLTSIGTLGSPGTSIGPGAGRQNCPGVANDLCSSLSTVQHINGVGGSCVAGAPTDNLAAINACMAAGMQIVLPSVCQGSGGFVGVSGGPTMSVNGNEIVGLANGNVTACPTVLANYNSGNTLNVICATSSCADIKVLDLTLLGNSVGATTVGLNLNNIGGGIGLSGNYFTGKRLTIKGTAQAFLANGWGLSSLTDSNLYSDAANVGALPVAQITGTTPDGWTFTGVDVSCSGYGSTTPYAGAALNYAQGRGSYVYLGGVSHCPLPITRGTAGGGTISSGFDFLGDTEGTGPLETLYYGSAAIVFEMGFEGASANTTGPVYQTNGSNSLTVLGLPQKSALATNAPVITVTAQGSGTGSCGSGVTQYYKVWGQAPSSSSPTGTTTVPSTEQSATTSNTTSSFLISWTAMPGIQTYGIGEGATSNSELILPTTAIEGATTSYVDQCTLTASGAIPTVATLYYPEANKSATNDDVAMFQPVFPGGGMGPQGMISDPNGEWYYGPDHIIEVADNSSPTGTAWNRGALYKVIARQSSAATSDGLYYCYENAAKTYTCSGNLALALSGLISLNDSTSGTQLSITQNGVGTSAPLSLLSCNNASAACWPQTLTQNSHTSGGIILRMYDYMSGDVAYGFSTSGFTWPWLITMYNSTAATNGTNHSSARFTQAGTAYSGTASVLEGMWTQTTINNTATTPNVTYLLGVSTGTGLTPNYYADFTAAAAGISLPVTTIPAETSFAGYAACYTTGGLMGHCTTVVGATGTCTCVSP